MIEGKEIMDPNVGVVIAVLAFAAVIIGCVSYVAVQFGHRAVEMQQDFTRQLVAGLGVAGGHHLASDVMKMGGVIDLDSDGRPTSGRTYRDNGQHGRVPDGFPQQRAAATEGR